MENQQLLRYANDDDDDDVLQMAYDCQKFNAFTLNSNKMML